MPHLPGGGSVLPAKEKSSLVSKNPIGVGATVVATEGQVSCDLQGEAAILNLESGVYYGLDSVGARIWDLIKEPKTVKELRDTLVEEFEVAPDRCEADLRDLLEKLSAEGLVEIKNEAAV